ncbi:MAG: nucleoid occlusion factor SlmA, partial [Gammaproteobacteria bacterium]|nr:nucleoid occlusion factor SlmA [Gammaproteobacteria bacterium]
MARLRSGERREEILQVLARMLQELPGEHITTAALAKSVGVSEAALYRHFPSKARMFESLIEFIEESVFSRINRILLEETNVEVRIQKIIALVLGFADMNPGMARLLQGGVLTGETERLRVRISQFFERIETQLRQVLREAGIAGASLPVNDAARLFLA